MKQTTKDVIWQHAMLLMFSLASVAVAAIVISTKYKLLPEYIIPIGQALLGSAIVGFIVDQSVRHKFLKEIGREIFGFIVGQYYPKEASEYINRFIKEGIILRNFVRRYTFVALDDRQVKIEVRVDYQVGNYGAVEELYAPKLQIKEKDLPEIIGLTCGLSGDKITHLRFEFRLIGFVFGQKRQR